MAQDAVGNIRTVASFTAEGRVLDLFERALAGPVVAARKKAVTSGASAGVAISLIPFSEAFIFYIGAIFIEKGYMTFQDMMQVFMALLMSASGVAMAMAQMGDVGAAKPATASVFALVDRMPVIDSEDPSGLKPDRCEGNVTLQAVHFAYPTRPGLTVLRGFSLELRVGEMAALVGESGSGAPRRRKRPVATGGCRLWLPMAAEPNRRRWVVFPPLLTRVACFLFHRCLQARARWCSSSCATTTRSRAACSSTATTCAS